MIHFKAAAFTLVVVAVFMVIGMLIAVIWPIIIIAALYFVILCILRAIKFINITNEMTEDG